jgi:hypothetical protein
MKWILYTPFRMALSSLLFFSVPAEASRTTYQSVNPFGWAHLMPTGETPGWSAKSWINFELSQANIWNSETTRIKNKKNKKEIQFLADYEQTSGILEVGRALGPKWAASLVVPYAYRDGGLLDDFIDHFHTAIGSYRFSRQFFQKDRTMYRITDGDQTTLDRGEGGGLGNLKLKLKFWMWQWRGSEKGACECGLSAGVHVKAPLEPENRGFTSGAWDYSSTFHFGLPLGKSSGFFATSAFTYTSPDDLTKDWPLRRWHQMYEASFDLSLAGGWGLLLIGRVESPWLNKGEVDFVAGSDDSEQVLAQKGASGWNGLVEWRGSQSLGLRYRGSVFDGSFQIVEDWGLGGADERADHLYVNNAPDVAFVFKLNSSF